MGIIKRLDFLPCDDEADDYRPDSAWGAAVDPETPDGIYVKDMSVIVDRVAPGDRVPLHTHDIDELVLVQDGIAEAQLGDQIEVVSQGALIFVPAGVAHGGRAIDEPVTFVGFFATDTVDWTYLERNPKPGTENDPPQPRAEYSPRT